MITQVGATLAEKTYFLNVGDVGNYISTVNVSNVYWLEVFLPSLKSPS